MHLKDIQNRQDIDYLVKSFYKKAIEDQRIGHFFTKVLVLDLENHLPTISDFWESILFQNGKYKGNPMLKHIVLSRKSPIKKQDFQRWLNLWSETVEELFKGPLADATKSKASSIAALMQHKISMDSF